MTRFPIFEGDVAQYMTNLAISASMARTVSALTASEAGMSVMLAKMIVSNV